MPSGPEIARYKNIRDSLYIASYSILGVQNTYLQLHPNDYCIVKKYSIMADISKTPPLTRDSVIEAHKLIGQYVHYTPVLTNRTITELASTPRTAEELEGTRYAGRTPARPVLRLWFKCENMQRIGAFKARGAFHAVERLKQEPGWLEGGGKEKGVVTHSSGKKSHICDDQEY